MANRELKLLGAWPSPFVLRVKLALNIKSLEYEFIAETMQPKSELLLKSNPVHKKIPVFLHGDKSICESLIIVEYIDETWSSGPSILPSDPYERAVARFWAAYIDEKWFPAFRALSMVEVEDKNKALTDLKEGLAFLEDAFQKCSKGKDFFSGDKIGYLDIAFGSMLGWIRLSEKTNGKLFDEEKTPGLLKWAEKFSADNAVKGHIPETEKLAEFAKVLIAKGAAAATK